MCAESFFHIESNEWDSKSETANSLASQQNADGFDMYSECCCDAQLQAKLPLGMGTQKMYASVKNKKKSVNILHNTVSGEALQTRVFLRDTQTLL